MPRTLRPHLSIASARWLLREGLRRAQHPRRERDQDGWASSSLQQTIRTALLVGMAGWLVVIVLTVFADLGWTRIATLLASAHLACLALTVVTLRRGWDRSYVVAGVYALFLLDWMAAPALDSVLIFTAWWMTVLAHTYVLDGRRWRLVTYGALLVVPATMLLTRPEWDTRLPLSFAVFLLVTTYSSRIGLSLIIDYTHEVDTEARELDAETAALETRRAAASQVAEDARVLHDTAINTLGAIANGSSGVRDSQLVRERCLADVDSLASLQALHPVEQPAREQLRETIRTTGIRVRHGGMSKESIAQLEALLPVEVARAFGRATAEAVQNADKHSGCDEVLVTIELVDGLAVVSIRDEGVGTDAPPRPGGGIERSILDRAAGAGITAAFTSAAGEGTTVTLTYPIGELPDDEHELTLESVDVDRLLREVRARASFLVLAGLLVVATALALFNHSGRPTPEWLMLGLVALTCWLARPTPAADRLPPWAMAILLVAGPLSFLTSFWSVDFGRTDPLLWQAVTPVGPTLAVVMLATTRATRVAAVAAYLATAIGVAGIVAPSSTEAAYISLAAGAAGIGVVIGVSAFMRTLTGLVARAAREHRERFAVRIETAAVEAAAESRRRWRQAGLEQSVELLRAIGEGRLSPLDPDVQERCGRQEQFLRQLTMLDPQLTQMGTWFSHALSAARKRGIGLTVRAGSTDAEAEQAGTLGRTVLDVIAAMPRGTALTTSLLVTTRGPVMTLVGSSPHLVTALGPEIRDAAGVSIQSLDGQDLVEIAFATHGEAVPPTDEHAGIRSV